MPYIEPAEERAKSKNRSVLQNHFMMLGEVGIPNIRKS
jgi:hypothetical protein